jgi:hypothetical protein
MSTLLSLDNTVGWFGLGSEVRLNNVVPVTPLRTLFIYIDNEDPMIAATTLGDQIRVPSSQAGYQGCTKEKFPQDNSTERQLPLRACSKLAYL